MSRPYRPRPAMPPETAAERNRRNIQQQGRRYTATYTVTRDTREILKRRSYSGHVPGMSMSSVIVRMVGRYDELIERMTPALTKQEWHMLRSSLGRGPFPNIIVDALDRQLEDALSRRPGIATSRGINIQEFLTKARKWSYAEKLCIIDGLERPIELGKTPIPYSDGPKAREGVGDEIERD